MTEDIILKTEKINFIEGSYYQYWSRPKQTLSNTYYNNMFELFKRSFDVRSNLIKYLYVNAENLNQVLNDNYINGIRFCCANLFKYDMNNSEKDKINKLKKILYDGKTIDRVLSYKGHDTFDNIICFCVKYKVHLIIYLLYKIRFIKRRWLYEFEESYSTKT